VVLIYSVSAVYQTTLARSDHETILKIAGHIIHEQGTRRASNLEYTRSFYIFEDGGLDAIANLRELIFVSFRLIPSLSSPIL
jgi:hypothetical protein